MRIEPVEIQYTYSCQKCQKLIESKQEVEIIPFFCPTCSNDCAVEVRVQILEQYPNPEIKEMLSFSLPNYKPTKRTESIKKLARWFLIKSTELNQ